jgi:uncharacterized protein YggU (UPF0235/DUF167 family)
VKLFVTVKTGAKEDRVDRVDEAHFRVSVKAPAREGKANEAVLKLLSDHFRLPRLRFSILRGLSTKNKVIGLK